MEDFSNPYAEINEANELELIYNDADYDTILSERLRRLKDGDGNLSELKNAMTNENIHTLKNLITKENQNIDQVLLDLGLLELRPRILNKNNELYLISDKNNEKVISVTVGNSTYRAVRITSKIKDGKQLLALSTLKSSLGLKDSLVKLLDNKNASTRPSLPPSGGDASGLEVSGLEAETSFINPVEINQESDLQVESTETLRQIVDTGYDAINEESFDILDAEINALRETIRPILEARELNKVLTAEDRQLITKYLDFVKENYNKKNELISDIERNKKIITEAERKLQIERAKSSIEENNIDELNKEISDAKANIQTSKQLLDQILAYNERIYEDVNTRLQSKFTLGQKLAYIFRKYGITAFALITAIGTVITTVLTAVGFSAVNNVIGGGIGGGIKKALQNFANWLLEVAKKAASNLPSIIGAIVSVLISIIASIIGFVAENLIVLVIAVSFALFEAIKSAYKRSKK